MKTKKKYSEISISAVILLLFYSVAAFGIFSQNIFGATQQVIKQPLDKGFEDARADFCDVRIVYNETEIPSQIVNITSKPYIVFLLPFIKNTSYETYFGKPDDRCPLYPHPLYHTDGNPPEFYTINNDQVYDRALNDLFKNLESCYILPTGVKKCVNYKSGNFSYKNLVSGPVLDIFSIEFQDDNLEQKTFIENYGSGRITDFRVEYILKNNVSLFCPIRVNLNDFRNLASLEGDHSMICLQNILIKNDTFDLFAAAKNTSDFLYLEPSSKTLDFAYCTNNTKSNTNSSYESRFVFTNNADCAELGMSYVDVQVTLGPKTIREQVIDIFNFKLTGITPELPPYANVGFKIIPNENFSGNFSLKIRYSALDGEDVEYVPFDEERRIYEFPQRTVRFQSNTLLYPFDSYKTSFELLENSSFKSEENITDPLPGSYGLLKVEKKFDGDEAQLLIKRNVVGRMLIILVFAVYFFNFHYVCGRIHRSRTERSKNSKKIEALNFVASSLPFTLIFTPNMFPLFSLLSLAFFTSFVYMLWMYFSQKR